MFRLTVHPLLRVRCLKDRKKIVTRSYFIGFNTKPIKDPIRYYMNLCNTCAPERAGRKYFSNLSRLEEYQFHTEFLLTALALSSDFDGEIQTCTRREVANILFYVFNFWDGNHTHPRKLESAMSSRTSCEKSYQSFLQYHA